MKIPKCDSCGQEMFEIGGIGKSVQIIDKNGDMIGIEEVKLFQCPECKDIILADLLQPTYPKTICAF